MHQTAAFGYRRGPGYRALELPYSGGRFAFDVLLPDPGQLRSLLGQIARVGPLELLHGLRPELVRLALPKLQLHTRFDLADELKTLGMPLAVTPGGSDLSGISGRRGDLYLKAVAHEAYLRVDEQGTEAAAATAGVVSTVSAQLAMTFDVNRPFVFVIRDVKTGAIPFIGMVSRP
jgi:serpin B